MLGRHQLRLLKFAIRYQGWQSYAKGDRAIRDALNSLQRMGLIEVNEFHMFRLKEQDDNILRDN